MVRRMQCARRPFFSSREEGIAMMMDGMDGELIGWLLSRYGNDDTRDVGR